MPGLGGPDDPDRLVHRQRRQAELGCGIVEPSPCCRERRRRRTIAWINQRGDIAIGIGDRFAERRQALFDGLVPAAVGLALLGQVAGDIELILGPRHRHVELPPILGLLLFVRRFLVLHGFGHVHDFRRRVDQQRRHRAQVDRAAVAAPLGDRGIGEDDDGGLETLGTMHRHHPDPGPGFRQFALDRHLAGAQFGEKSQQRRLRRLFVQQCQVEELGHDVVDLAAEPVAHPLQAAAGIEHIGVEIERPLEVEPVAPGLQLRAGGAHRGDVRALQRPPQPLVRLAGMGHRQQVVFAHLEQWRAQQCR